jgi:hypothetical protein
MIHHQVIQGSEEWQALRCGRPTASEFSRIIQPKKWGLAAGRRSYQIELLTELALGGPLGQPTTPAMLHGHDFEAKARSAYELVNGVDVEPCGFCTNDAGSAGASPDAFVGKVGLLELKNPMLPQVHMDHVLEPLEFLAEHWVQVQSQLYICDEREWCDLVSYWPLPESEQRARLVSVRVKRHPEFQKKLDAALTTFLREFEELKELALSRGVRFPDRTPAAAPDYGSDGVTMADVEEILSQRRG